MFVLPVDRLQHELSLITQHGYAPLFLVVADIVRFAREHDIPVSTRGSVANSLVAYCAGITTVDPDRTRPALRALPQPGTRQPARYRPGLLQPAAGRGAALRARHLRRRIASRWSARSARCARSRPCARRARLMGLADARIDRLVSLLPHNWHPDPRRRDKRTVDDVLAALDDPRRARGRASGLRSLSASPTI